MSNSSHSNGGRDTFLSFFFGRVVVVWNVQISLYPSIPMMDDRHGDKTCIHIYQTAYYTFSITSLLFYLFCIILENNVQRTAFCRLSLLCVSVSVLCVPSFFVYLMSRRMREIFLFPFHLENCLAGAKEKTTTTIIWNTVSYCGVDNRIMGGFHNTRQSLQHYSGSSCLYKRW